LKPKIKATYQNLETFFDRINRINWTTSNPETPNHFVFLSAVKIAFDF